MSGTVPEFLPGERVLWTGESRKRTAPGLRPMTYLLTNQRVLAVRTGTWEEQRAFDLLKLGRPIAVPQGDGTSTIFFGDDALYLRQHPHGRTRDVGDRDPLHVTFEHIADAEVVAARITEAVRDAWRGGNPEIAASIGDRELWRGAPMRSSSRIAGLGGLVCILSATGGIRAAVTEGGVVAVVVGVSMAVAVLFGVAGLVAQLRQRRRTEYVLTERRILVTDRRTGATVQATDLAELQPPEVRTRKDGSGTITFGQVVRVGRPPIRLEEVPDAAQVGELILAAQRRAKLA